MDKPKEVESLNSARTKTPDFGFSGEKFQRKFPQPGKLSSKIFSVSI
jgi:hypothetical protein